MKTSVTVLYFTILWKQDKEKRFTGGFPEMAVYTTENIEIHRIHQTRG